MDYRQHGSTAFESRAVSRPALPLAPYTGHRVEAREKFAALSARLLGDGGEAEDFRRAAAELYNLFNEIGGRPQDTTSAGASAWRQGTLLPGGNAINPHAAAACLLDDARTRAFGRGVRAAVEAAQLRFPGERVEILYAGTGPFAPLALLQCAFFGPDEVRFTLIDMHPAALSCLAQVIAVLGLEDYVAETVQADAMRWRPGADKKYHVAIAEVMQRGLIVEPQVAVTLALLTHLRPGGFLVPERVELTLCLLNPGAEKSLSDAALARLSAYFRLSADSIPDCLPAASSERVAIGPAFALTAAVAEAYEVTDTSLICLPPLRLPDSLPPGHKLRILTRITTPGGNVLGDYDSGLTFPEPLVEEPPLQAGAWYEVWYGMQGIPGLRLMLAEEEPA